MKRFLFLSIYLFIGYKVFSQNLIPNPYFADLESCPVIAFQFDKVKNWFSVQNSPDIFDSCSNDEYILLATSFQNAHKGESFIGLITYMESLEMEGREIAGVKLLETLNNDIIYCLNFYCSLSEKLSGKSINKLGVVFFDTLTEWNPFEYMEFNNHDIGINQNSIGANWSKISGSITGNGQKYMAVGSWIPNSQLNVISLSNSDFPEYAYYFFDDFHLYEVKPAEYDVLLPEPCEENEEATLSARYYEEVRWYVLPDTVNAVGTDSVFIVSLTQDTTQILLYSRLCEYEFTDTITLIKPVCPPEPEPEIPEPVINIPNIITPNGDGVNDVFYIENLPEGVELYIYNRWGNLIFETSNYNNQWQPTSDITDGVYYYLVKLPNGESRTGFFTIVR